MSSWHEVLARLPHHQIEVVSCSRLFETVPVGGPVGQSTFLNAALTVRTRLSAPDLVVELLAVEREIGRVRETRWGPRLVDLDLMLFESQVHDLLPCLVPHPRMTFRRFMLEPACEVASDWIHPITQCSLASLLEQLPRINGKARLLVGANHRPAPDFESPTDQNRLNAALDGLMAAIQEMGWEVSRGPIGSPATETRSAFNIFVTAERHPAPGSVHGPYLVLPVDETEQWTSDVVAAFQSLR
ncbi:MAG: 2-amino-4-hydroxy-6-hydroxymethyldihydropteridine diphosphokinase [Planctomycetaceae bacterium]|nr:2-amino-4-hydroxy-6-hydroxymethyldihydropteridine diphosphokinase [Planctomycetaceae bacterium]